MFYGGRNRDQTEKRMLTVTDIWIVEIIRHLYVVVYYINYLLPLGGSILANILRIIKMNTFILEMLYKI